MPSVYKEPRKTIAVNLDNTLSHTMEALLDWHNLQYHTNHTMTDLQSTQLHDLWGGSPEDACYKIRQFYQSDHFTALQPIMDFALEALKMLKKRKFHLVIITSRQQFIAEETKRFVDMHYPGK
jgi:5'(3')-deoxyribonucleotidase